jgi:hypothetical protein
MSALIKWKKALPLAVAAGIMCLSAYGIYHTVNAYTDITQSQAPDDSSTLQVSPENNLIPGGTVCNPLGCAACGGCTTLLYQENIETLPDSYLQVEQIG